MLFSDRSWSESFVFFFFKNPPKLGMKIGGGELGGGGGEEGTKGETKETETPFFLYIVYVYIERMTAIAKQ